MTLNPCHSCGTMPTIPMGGIFEGDLYRCSTCGYVAPIDFVEWGTKYIPLPPEMSVLWNVGEETQGLMIDLFELRESLRRV